MGKNRVRRWLQARGVARARKKLRKKHGEALYQRALLRARAPQLYLRFALPDTADGRLDALILHLFFYARRFEEGQPDLVRAMTETFITQLDRALREMGVGDLSVAKKMKRVLCCLFGAFESYRAARSSEEWQAALARNIFHSSTVSPRRLVALASYCLESMRAIEGVSLRQILVEGGALPECAFV